MYAQCRRDDGMLANVFKMGDYPVLNRQTIPMQLFRIKCISRTKWVRAQYTRTNKLLNFIESSWVTGLDRDSNSKWSKRPTSTPWDNISIRRRKRATIRPVRNMIVSLYDFKVRCDARLRALQGTNADGKTTSWVVNPSIIRLTRKL